MFDEVWKDIPEFPKYQVSNFGRVRSLKNGENKILKVYLQKNGYVQVCFWQNKKCNKRLLHRLVASLFLENPHNYKEVNHKDENKGNNRVDNLEWCTHSYNMHFGSCFEKIRTKAIGRIVNEETKQKLKIDSSNKRWMNDKTKESFVKKENINYLLSQGWEMGRLKRKEVILYV